MKRIKLQGSPNRPLLGGWIALLVALAALLLLGLSPSRSPINARIEKNVRAHQGIALVDGRALVDINTADLELLVELPGIGEALANAILLERQKNGPFDSLDDLERVPGIGEKTRKSLEDCAIAVQVKHSVPQ